MNYMMDKINLHKNKDEIIKVANEIVNLLKSDEKLDSSEKLMTIELAVPKSIATSLVKNENKPIFSLLFFCFYVCFLFEFHFLR